MRLALLIAFLCLPFASGAQDAPALTRAGTLVVGGNANATFAEDIKSYGISPRLGIFVADGLAVGARVNVSRSTFDNGFSESRSTLIGAEPFATYYLGSPEAIIQPYVSAAAGVVYIRTANQNNPSPPRQDNVTYTGEASAGAILRLGSNVGLTGEAYYRHTFGDLDLSQGGLRAGIAVFLAR